MRIIVQKMILQKYKITVILDLYLAVFFRCKKCLKTIKLSSKIFINTPCLLNLLSCIKLNNLKTTRSNFDIDTLTFLK